MLRGKDFGELDDVVSKLCLLASTTKTSFVLTGGEAPVTFARDRIQLTGEAAHLPMKPVGGPEAFISMLGDIETAGGHQPNPALRDDELVGLLLDLTKSLYGRAVTLLREAAKVAIFHDVGQIEVDHMITVIDRSGIVVGENPLSPFVS